MIINKAKKTKAFIHIDKGNSFKKRLLGFMFRKDPLKNEALLLTPCKSIHMCFMLFSIDAVFIDQNGVVVGIRENLRPWNIVLPIKKAHSTLELPIGSVKLLQIESGDQLQLN
ncbi:DUF192 domain-containing protein [Terrihalobacillus insolitus]|uniref:DUF192 domain-containing protein n=1 Tax=Terrihalobacillus insolitus TaxID=2950438 RepID=UPI002341FF55|nr:DUF192 domain-containing protein [Terrihalobacillus insolitus]MDC3413850.1 DUF192 domain-containing protein [Terrihalobacillus insolitus]